MKVYFKRDAFDSKRASGTSRFAYQQALIQQEIWRGRKYDANGQRWIDSDDMRQLDQDARQGQTRVSPDATRIAFDSLDSYRAARDVYAAWSGLDHRFVSRPVLPQKAFERIAAARRTGKPLRLFAPWGVRPDYQKGARLGLSSPEAAVMGRIGALAATLRANNVPTEVVVMAADTYATEVNSYPKDLADGYFSTVGGLASGFGFSYCTWSALKQAYAEVYKPPTAQQIKAMVPPSIIKGAQSAAAARCGSDDPAVQEASAFAYMAERLAEAELVDTVFEPIKVSAVDPRKDRVLDRELPRLYIVPNELRFPWLQGCVLPQGVAQ